mgnify:FL=1
MNPTALLKRWRLILPAAFILMVLSRPGLAGDTPSPEGAAFLPHAGLAVEGGGYLDNQAGYSMLTRRLFLLDVLRLGRWTLSTFITESVYYGGDHEDFKDPYLIHYDMEYFNLRYSFRFGYLSFFADHLCNNLISRGDSERYQFRWYGYGIKWESRGMRLGEKNPGPVPGTPSGFLLLNRLSYLAAAETNWAVVEFKYDYLLRGALRYDIFQWYRTIPYAEVSAFGIVDGSLRVDRSAEAGLRIRFSRADITPFYRYSLVHDTDTYRGTTAALSLFGLRLETPFGLPEEQPSEVKIVREGPVGDESGRWKSPELHFSGSYAKYLADDYLNVETDILFVLDLIKWDDLTLFSENKLLHNSRKENFGLYPRYLQFGAESGLAWWFSHPGIYLEGFHRYVRKDEGNYDLAPQPEYHAAALRLRSRGMKTGLADSNIAFPSGDGVACLNSLSYSLSLGKNLHRRNHPYPWSAEARLRWDITRIGIMIPYLLPGMDLSWGVGHLWESHAEGGVRFHSAADFTLFYCHRYRSEAEPDWGYGKTHHLVGLRVEM